MNSRTRGAFVQAIKRTQWLGMFLSGIPTKNPPSPPFSEVREEKNRNIRRLSVTLNKHICSKIISLGAAVIKHRLSRPTNLWHFWHRVCANLKNTKLTFISDRYNRIGRPECCIWEITGRFYDKTKHFGIPRNSRARCLRGPGSARHDRLPTGERGNDSVITNEEIFHGRSWGRGGLVTTPVSQYLPAPPTQELTPMKKQQKACRTKSCHVALKLKRNFWILEKQSGKFLDTPRESLV